jgi:chaperonin cofactor prefoldin
METATKMHRIRQLWPAAVVLAGCVFSVGWVGVRVSPVEARVAPLDARLDSAEIKLNTLSKERAGTTERMAQIERSANSGIQRARTECTALSEGIRRETSRRFEPLQSRVASLESTQLELHAELVRLREELALLRGLQD